MPHRHARRRPPGLAAVLATSTVGGHLVYPVVLAALTRGGRHGPRPSRATCPPLTVLIPAYREAGIIADKVADVEANGYPGELRILVVADDAETADAARTTCAEVLQPEGRLGKAQAVNLGMAAARTEIVVLSDANNRLTPGSLALVASHFGDPAVGGVAGEKVEADAGGEEAYWRFESWLKQREWALGTTIGVTGELLAVRRAAWEPIPADISSDDLWIALDLSERGHAIAYEPSARAIDPPTGDAADRWERRTRMIAGSLLVFWRKRHLLSPGAGVVGLQIVGHRLWRSTAGPLSHLALLLLATRHARGSRVAALFVGGHVAGAAALGWRESGRRLPGPLAGAVQVLYLQLVALGGMVRFARGDRVLRWTKRAR